MAFVNRYTVLDTDTKGYKHIKQHSENKFGKYDSRNEKGDKKLIRKNFSDEFSDNISDESNFNSANIGGTIENTENIGISNVRAIANSVNQANLTNHTEGLAGPADTSNTPNQSLKWRRFDTESLNNTKYKNFNSFSNFNNQKKLKVIQKDDKNRKRVLCNNIVTTGSCCYGNKCTYAHSLAEQQVDQNRKNAYDILLSTTDLSNINFQENVSLYRALRELTKICNIEHCTGGYNCRNGVCRNKKYCICAKDLDYGDCTNQTCEFVHLTKRGLKPFYSGYTIPQTTTYLQETYSEKMDRQFIPGTLLTTDFINNLPQRFPIGETQADELSDISSESEIIDDTNETDECDQSIFDP